MAHFLLILICLIAGYLLKSAKGFPENAAAGLKAFIVYFCLPAVALKYLPAMKLSAEVLLPFASSWLVWGVSWLLFRMLGKWRGWSKKTTAALTIMGGLSNTSFVGFPLISAWFGADYISYALFADQGAFLVMATVGIALAERTQTGASSLRQLLHRLLKFPPFVAFLLGLLLQWVPLPAFWFDLMGQLSAPLVPLALVSVGLQLDFKEPFHNWKQLGLGLGYKLVLAPLFVLALYFFVMQTINPYTEIAVFESAMAPMVTAFIICTQYNIQPRLAAMMVGVGIPLSLLTTAGWYAVIAAF